jgi:hypothetical protein
MTNHALKKSFFRASNEPCHITSTQDSPAAGKLQFRITNFMGNVMVRRAPGECRLDFFRTGHPLWFFGIGPGLAERLLHDLVYFGPDVIWSSPRPLQFPARSHPFVAFPRVPIVNHSAGTVFRVPNFKIGLTSVQDAALAPLINVRFGGDFRGTIADRYIQLVEFFRGINCGKILLRIELKQFFARVGAHRHELAVKFYCG